MDAKKDKKLTQFKLGKEINFLNKIDELIKKDAIPEVIYQDSNLESSIRLAKVLNETADFLKEVVTSQARTEMRIIELNEELHRLLPEKEVIKEDNNNA